MSCCTPRRGATLRSTHPLADIAFAFGSTFGADAPTDLRLPIDILEKDNAYVVYASLPGFRKEEVSVEVEDGVLTIRAAHGESAEAEGVSWMRRERMVARYSRQVRLPEGVTGEGISAALADGILTVTIPQPPKAQPVKVAVN